MDPRVTIVMVAGAGGWWRAARDGWERRAGRAAGQRALGTQQHREAGERQAQMTQAHRKQGKGIREAF